MADESLSLKRTRTVCIECGSKAGSTFTRFHSGTIKLKECVSCRAIVDKYIEYDNVMVLLDILLHKSQAYRHVLFNMEIKVVKQLLVLSILCDTYMKWNSFYQMCLKGFPSSKDWHLVLELQFYTMLAITSLELLLNFSVTSAIVSYANCKRKITFYESMKSMPRILVLSSYGKLLAIAALVWYPENTYWYLALTKMFVVTSNAQAIKVSTQRRFEESIAYVACGALTGFLVQDYAVGVLFSNWQPIDPI